MKLRNKKTEEIVDVYNIYISKRVEDDSLTSHENVIRSFDSIAELNEDWEDYQPTEPLIKDEKIRKAVRAWAEANKFLIFVVNNKQSNTFEIRGLADIGDAHGCSIYFKGTISKANNITYTIAELCGEEEE